MSALKNNFENQHFGTVDYIVFAILMLVSSAVGIYYGFFTNVSKSVDQYMMGGHKMKIIPIAISLVASQLSGMTMIGVPAEMYSFGTQYSMTILGTGLAALVVGYIFIPVFYNNKLSNCYKYLEMRFSQTVCQFITALYVLKTYLLMPIIIFAPSLAFSQVSGGNVHVINMIVCSICVFYTFLGGIKAVVWTDVIQGGVMLGSSLLIVYFGVEKVGSFSEVFHIANQNNRIEFFNMDFDLTARQTFWSSIFGYFALWSAYIGLNQSCAQRIIALPSISHARKSLFAFFIGYSIIITVVCFIGIVMYARYSTCDPVLAKVVKKADMMLPFFVQDVIGDFQGISGIFISCVFSAALSTMSASLHSVAGVICSDYVSPFLNMQQNDVKANFLMKTIIVFTGFYCVLMGFVVENFSSIVQSTITVSGTTSGVTLGVFSLGMLYPRSNKIGALWGSLISFGFVSWIAVGSQILFLQGKLVNHPLPTTIEECPAFGLNVTVSHALNDTLSVLNEVAEPLKDDSFSIYKIAFSWFSAIGALLVWVFGVPISHFTAPPDMEKNLSRKLITPIAHWLIPRKYRYKTGVELKLFSENLENKSGEIELPLVSKENEN